MFAAPFIASLDIGGTLTTHAREMRLLIPAIGFNFVHPSQTYPADWLHSSVSQVAGWRGISRC